MRNNPSPAESKIVVGTPDVDEGGEGSAESEKKVDPDEQIRIQLASIGMKKLSVNKANVYKIRDLEFENLKLQCELRELQQTLRKAGLVFFLSSGQCPSSPSAPVTQQATTSIGSAPVLSGFVAHAHVPTDECIQSTQVRQKCPLEAPIFYQ